MTGVAPSYLTELKAQYIAQDAGQKDENITCLYITNLTEGN